MAYVKLCFRDENQIVRFNSIIISFRLLSEFSNNRNKFASVFYKQLTFTLIENYNDYATRELVITNFIIILEEIKQLPVRILLEPLAK